MVKCILLLLMISIISSCAMVYFPPSQDYLGNVPVDKSSFSVFTYSYIPTGVFYRRALADDSEISIIATFLFLPLTGKLSYRRWVVDSKYFKFSLFGSSGFGAYATSEDDKTNYVTSMNVGGVLSLHLWAFELGVTNKFSNIYYKEATNILYDVGVYAGVNFKRWTILLSVSNWPLKVLTEEDIRAVPIPSYGLSIQRKF